jgi:hypothetical protein
MKRSMFSIHTRSLIMLRAMPILLLAMILSAVAYSGLPPTVSAAVSTLDAWPATPQMTGTTGNPTNATFPISAGENRLVIVLVACYDSGGSSGQTFSATYGTKTLTQAYLQNSNGHQTWIGYLSESDIASRTGNTVTVAVNGTHTGVRAYVASYSGVDQNAPISAASGTYINGSDNATIGGPLDVNADGYGIYGWAGAGGVTRTEDTEDYTEHSDMSDAATFNCGVASKGFAAATTTNPSVTWSAYNQASVSFITLNRLINPVPTTNSISPDTKTYGDSGFTLTVYGTDFVAGSVVKVDGNIRTTTYVSPTELTAAIPPGDLKPWGARSVTVFNPEPGGGTSNAQILTVLKRDLTVTATGVDKVYDASTDATVILTTDALASDNVAAFGTASFADKNVGTAKVVSVTGIYITGTDADNYNLQNTTASTTADITPRDLTVSATGINKVYDGTTNATVTLTTDAMAGDSIIAAYTSASFADEDVGTDKVVSVSGISISGADVTNYTLLNTTTSTTADITPRELTLDGIIGNNKVYDGTTDATVDFSSASLVGVLPGETVGVDYSMAVATFDNENVGSGKTITVTGVVLTGADTGNYTLTPTTTADITPRDLTVTAAGINKVYDGTIAAMVNISTDALAGDNVTAYGTASFADKNVGTGKTVSVSGISISGADAANYALVNTTSSTTADITPRDLTVTATGISKAYDGTTNATVTLTADVVAGDNVTAYGTASFADKNVGTGKTVSVSGISISGADAANYALVNTTASTTADITPKELTLDGIAANNKVYDGTTSATVNLNGASLVGVLLGETVGVDYSLAVATFDDKNVGSSKTITITGVVLTGADAGNYALTPTTTADITPRDLTVTATGIHKVYDGTTDATVSLNTDAVAGDSIIAAYASASFADKDVGTDKAVSVSGISITGTDAANYHLVNGTALATANVTPKAITITANDLTKTRGETVTFEGTEFTVSGLEAGDTITSVTLTSDGAAAGAKVSGSPYDIVPSAAIGTGLANYNITYVNGALTIKAAGGGVNWGLIGGSIGGVLGVLLLSAVVVLWRRRMSKQPQSS